jgi:predicted secreted hydrolase
MPQPPAVASTGFAYWEGAITGRGYLEMTGYHRPMATRTNH